MEITTIYSTQINSLCTHFLLKNKKDDVQKYYIYRFQIKSTPADTLYYLLKDGGYIGRVSNERAGCRH